MDLEEKITNCLNNPLKSVKNFIVTIFAFAFLGFLGWGCLYSISNDWDTDILKSERVEREVFDFNRMDVVSSILGNKGGNTNGYIVETKDEVNIQITDIKPNIPQHEHRLMYDITKKIDGIIYLKCKESGETGTLQKITNGYILEYYTGEKLIFKYINHE
jgi:hypothetical protein